MSARNFKLFGNAKKFGNVVVARDDRFIQVFLHGNEVVTVDTLKYLIRLSNCGWVTPTTHSAINTALSQLGAPFHVNSLKGVTYLVLHPDFRNTTNTTNTARPLVNGEWLRYNPLNIPRVI